MIHDTAIVTRMDAKMTRIRIVSRAGDVASAMRTITVVIAPGPASIGMPRGTIPMASRSRASCRSWAVSWVRERTPWMIEKAIEKSKIPPAIRKAGIEVPKNRKMLFPTNAKMSRVTVAASTAFSITRFFTTGGYDRVRTTKKVIAPTGFTIAKIATKVVAAKPTRSAMVPRPTEGPVLESVEHFPRERQIAGVAQWGERGTNAVVADLHSALNELCRPDVNEGTLPQRDDGLFHLLHVRRETREMAACFERGPTCSHGRPWVGDIQHRRVNLAQLDLLSDISLAEVDARLESRGCYVRSCDILQLGPRVIGYNTSTRPNAPRQCHGQGAGSGACLDHLSSGLNVSSIQDRGDVFG